MSHSRHEFDGVTGDHNRGSGGNWVINQKASTAGRGIVEVGHILGEMADIVGASHSHDFGTEQPGLVAFVVESHMLPIDRNRVRWRIFFGPIGGPRGTDTLIETRDEGRRATLATSAGMDGEGTKAINSTDLHWVIAPHACHRQTLRSPERAEDGQKRGIRFSAKGPRSILDVKLP